MCFDPVTLGMVVGGASTLLSGIGAIQQGQQQKAAANYNAKVADMQALDARRRGSEAEGQQRTKAALFLGQQRAQMGASGAVVDQDSYGDVLAQTAEFGERDAQMMRVNAERQAWGYETEAKQSRYQGRQAATAGLYRAGSTLLTGGFDLFRQTPWYKNNKW